MKNTIKYYTDIELDVYEIFQILHDELGIHNIFQILMKDMDYNKEELLEIIETVENGIK